MDQLSYIMEICGVPGKEVLDLAARKHLFFNPDDTPILAQNAKGKDRIPNSKTLEKALKCNDQSFIDFLKACFAWHPCDRITPLQALQHEWILDGLPEKVLLHHRKMFSQQEDPE